VKAFQSTTSIKDKLIVSLDS